MNNETTNNGMQWIRLEQGAFVKASLVEIITSCDNSSRIVADLSDGKRVDMITDLTGLGDEYKGVVLETLVNMVAQGRVGVIDCTKLKACYSVRYALSKHKLSDFLAEEDLKVLAGIPVYVVKSFLDMSLESFCCGFSAYKAINSTTSNKSNTVREAEFAARDALSAIYTKINELGLFPFKVKEDMLSYPAYQVFKAL